MKQTILLISIFLWSCQRGDDCFTNKGANGSVSRKLEVFDKISIENRLNLIITQDSVKAGDIVISGPENLLEEIFLKNQHLEIHNFTSFNLIILLFFNIENFYIKKITNVNEEILILKNFDVFKLIQEFILAVNYSDSLPLNFETNKANKEYKGKMAEIDNRNSLAQQKLQLERDKIKLARENQANDLAVAKQNAKGRNK